MDHDAAPDRLAPRLGDHAYVPLKQLAAALSDEAARTDGGAVLDLGCGTKPYASLFRGDYLGIDLVVERARADCAGQAEYLPFRSHSIPTVLSTQHLEHADDPDRVLTEVHRVLQADGTLLLSTHGVWIHHPDPHDYWRWTEEGLRHLLARNGFETVRVHRQGELFAAGLLLASYPAGAAGRSRRRVVRRLGRVLVGAVNLVVMALDRQAARLPRHYASVNYLVVARPVEGPVPA